MKKEALLPILKKKIRVEFDTNSEAAATFGINESALSRTLSGELVKIPEPILSWAGYKLEEANYIKVRK